jgi:hypothetical protein
MFEVPTQAAIAPQPAKGTFYDPAARQHNEPCGLCGTSHDFQLPPKLFANMGRNIPIGAIGPDEFQPTPAIVDVAFEGLKEALQYQLAARPIRHASAVTTINNNPSTSTTLWRLCPGVCLWTSTPRAFPPSEVFTLCLSIIAALG